MKHRAAALLSILAPALVATAAAQPAGCVHEVVASAPQHLESRLRAAAAAGFRVAAVARPDASAPPPPVPIVLLARPAAPEPPAGVAVEWARSLEDLEAAVNQRADGGARLRGITRSDATGAAWGNWVAVLETPAGEVAAGTHAAYRLVLSRGDVAEWRRLEEAAAEGFRVVDVLWWPDPARSALGEVVFVAERLPGAAPREIELEWEPIEKLEAALERLSAKGFVADVAWTSRDYVNVLMSRPRGAPPFRGDRFEVDEDPGLPAVSAMSGRLVDRLAFRDGQVAIYDHTQPSEGYALEWGPLGGASATRPSVDERDLAAALDHAGRDGGLCAFDAVWQQLPGRGPELLVMSRRPAASP